MHLSSRLAVASSLVCALSVPALAAGLDRDGLLAEAPATPDTGNVRISGGGRGEVAGGGSGQVSATVMWTPVQHLSADVSGAYLSDGSFGPTARVRYQLLDQTTHGLDLSVGARFKYVGFSTNPATSGGPSELELLVAGGRKFGALDVVVNAVVGTEVGDPGKDAELKAFVGYHLLDSLRVGVDSRVQAEFVDEAGTKVPDFANDVALIAGPAASWLVTPKVQVQALVGAFKGRGDPVVGAGGQLLLAIDL